MEFSSMIQEEDLDTLDTRLVEFSKTYFSAIFRLKTTLVSNLLLMAWKFPSLDSRLMP